MLGRRDEQVKIRGYRVEPSEVSAALQSSANTSAAVVVARPIASGEMRLFGYVEEKETSLSQAEIKSALNKRLPTHLVPDQISLVDRIPLLPNGKIDRSALPEPTAPDDQEYVAPRNDDEKALVAIWEKHWALIQLE